MQINNELAKESEDWLGKRKEEIGEKGKEIEVNNREKMKREKKIDWEEID